MNKREFQELKERFAKETRRRKINKLLNFLTTFISILGVTVISYYFISELNLNGVKENSLQSIVRVDSLYSTLKEIRKENAFLREEIRQMRTRLGKNVDSIKPQVDSMDYLALNEIRLKTVENKLKSIEQIILDSPEKALSIPFLSKEIENEKTNNANRIELLQDKISTVVDLNKWILGLIFSLLITIVISNLLGLKQKKDNKEDSEKIVENNI